MSDHIDRFRRTLLGEWLPAFCHDPKRRLDPAGFRLESIRASSLDAANALRAFEAGVVRDAGGGRYRCPRSKAFEQFFWTGSKGVEPRPLTLWMEPVITVATVGRLHLEFGWPVEQIGMQSADWAFDFAVYEPIRTDRMLIAGEVKKSTAEVDHLLADLQACSDVSAYQPASEHPRHVNSFRKWSALRAARVPLFWAVGPDDYSFVLRVVHTAETARFEAGSTEDLRAPLGE